MPSRRFRYQDPECPLTLRQGLEEYFAGHPGLIQDSANPETCRFFHAHDACHVMFGLDTTVADEGLADCWTLFGTDVGLKRYLKYVTTDPAAKQVVKEIGVLRTLVATVYVVFLVCPVFLRSRRMRRKWEWGGEDQYLDCPLRDLRREFNIQIL
jgi:hypothetical protein